MDNLTCNVTNEEFRLFHTIDRDLYFVLVRDLARNATESLHIMGLWLWLERRGCSNLVHKILSQPLIYIVTLADEAMACLRCLDDRYPVRGTTGIPLTSIISGMEVSLEYFQENRIATFHGVQSLVSEVCLPALSDILERARQGEFQNRAAPNQVVLPVHAPGVSADTLVGNFSGLRIQGNAGLGPSQEEQLADRTMFVTFSKGYPVPENDVWSFFAGLLGVDSLEEIQMQEVGPGEQVLYAKVIFKNPLYIRLALRGHVKVRFTIKGKHVCMRKYVPRNGHGHYSP